MAVFFFFFRDMVLDGKNECAKLHFTRHKIIVNVYNLLFNGVRF